MKSSTILFIGSIIVVLTAGLWYFDKIEEPMFSIVSALLTALAFYFARKEERTKSESKELGKGNVFNEKTKIGIQINNPTGNINLKNPKNE